MRRKLIQVLAAAAVLVLVSPWALAGAVGLGIPVAPPSTGSYATLLAADGGGGVYDCDGDTLYALSGGSFSSIFGGIKAAAGSTVDPSGLAVNASGTLAYVATGYSGRVVEIDIGGGTARELSDVRLTSNYGIAVDPIYGLVFLTDSADQSLYLLDPTGNGTLTLLDDFGMSGMYGGGIGFSPNGELIVAVPISYSVYPIDDNFTVDMYRFSRAWLDDLAVGTIATGAGVRYAQNVVVSGCGAVTVDARGHAYLAGADAVYAVSVDGDRLVVGGDPGLNAWNMWGHGFSGLAYDAAGDRLLASQAPSAGADYELYQVDLVRTLTMQVDPGGGGTTTPVVGSHAYVGGSVVNLEAFAAAGYQFDHWSGGVSGSSNPTTVTMNSDQMVTAHFVPVAPPQVESLEVFYNDSPGFGDDPDPLKEFLAVGQASQTSVDVDDNLHGHVTNYLQGITGIRVTFDTVVTFSGGVAAAFAYEATPEQSSDKTFTPFIPPTAPVYAVDDGTGKTVVTITFTDGEIRNRWLKTMVDASQVLSSGSGLDLDGELTAPLTLPSGDGSAGGDAEFIIGNRFGDVDGNYRCLLNDAILVRNHVGGAFVPISNVFDLDKSGRALLNDAILARSQVSGVALPSLP